ncbi:MAG: hypothetical protein E7598_08520 [Ruminococcaceae bacterium]|nr:hypothetical protein [Oscillospiraceae bacterium]
MAREYDVYDGYRKVGTIKERERNDHLLDAKIAGFQSLLDAIKDGQELQKAYEAAQKKLPECDEKTVKKYHKLMKKADRCGKGFGLCLLRWFRWLLVILRFVVTIFATVLAVPFLIDSLANGFDKDAIWIYIAVGVLYGIAGLCHWGIRVEDTDWQRKANEYEMEACRLVLSYNPKVK